MNSIFFKRHFSFRPAEYCVNCTTDFKATNQFNMLLFLYKDFSSCFNFLVK